MNEKLVTERISAFSPEEQRIAKELNSYLAKSIDLFVECRLSAEIGPDMAAKVMQSLNELVDKGLSEEEIAVQLRKEMGEIAPKAAAVGVGMATGICVVAICRK